MNWSWIHPVWAIGLPVAAAPLLGRWMARVLDPPADRAGRGLDLAPRALCRAIGRRGPAAMTWKQYALALVTFHVALFALAFLVLLAQGALPLNPDGKGPLTALGAGPPGGPAADTALVFNTVCSFVTNTNLQHYAGEQHLSYFSQLGAVVWLQFVTPACGLAAMLAVARGLRGDAHLGDFYLDMFRGLVLVLLPLSLVFAVVLVGLGVPMTFQGAAHASTLEGPRQTIALGPVAAEVAIKQLGTNGGGYFGANSAHPFENPGPASNLLEIAAILLLPMASIAMLGRMIHDRGHARVIFGAMLVLLLAGTGAAIVAESGASAETGAGAGAETGTSAATTTTAGAAAPSAGPLIVGEGGLEGKEVRIGATASATWAAVTTASSNGSVNAMLDSFQPLAGLVPMALVMLNVAFSGIGAGFLNMLMYVLIAVFLAGLMVGRTPEYLGKKVEAREVKLATIAILVHPLLICCGAALFAAGDWGRSTVANPGPHGFSEILYEFASAAANNGSGFEGLADNNVPWNVATGVVLLLGRFPALILPIAIAGSLARKKRTPPSAGTLQTNNLTFAAMLLGSVLLVGALSFAPAVLLGPVADHLIGASAAP